jgi:hypothetical protein
MITPLWQPPCSCEACTVARVTERQRPFPECHGRDLLRWWLEYERFQFAARKALKPMPAAPVSDRQEGQ